MILGQEACILVHIDSYSICICMYIYICMYMSVCIFAYLVTSCYCVSTVVAALS